MKQLKDPWQRLREATTIKRILKKESLEKLKLIPKNLWQNKTTLILKNFLSLANNKITVTRRRTMPNKIQKCKEK